MEPLLISKHTPFLLDLYGMSRPHFLGHVLIWEEF